MTLLVYSFYHANVHMFQLMDEVRKNSMCVVPRVGLYFLNMKEKPAPECTLLSTSVGRLHCQPQPETVVAQ